MAEVIPNGTSDMEEKQVTHNEPNEQSDMVEKEVIPNGASDMTDMTDELTAEEIPSEELVQTNGFSDDFTQCDLCKEIYKSPKALPCLHSYCCACLENHIGKSMGQNGQRYFECPSCDLVVDIPIGALQGHYADSFPDDSFISKLVELMDAMKINKKCDICERGEADIAATSWCMDCYDALCGTCLQVHLHSKMSSSHIVIAMEEMRNLPLELIMKTKSKVPCVKHSETITLFCVDCREPLCVQCMAVNHRRCENVVTVADAMSSRSDVQEVMELLQSMQTSYEYAGVLGEAEKVLEDTIESSKNHIKSVCDALCQRIRAQETAALAKLDKRSKEARKLLKERLEPKKIHVKTVKSANDRMKSMMRYGSDVEILLAYHQVKNQLDACENAIQNNERQNNLVKVDFTVDDVVDRFLEEFECLGHINMDAGGCDAGLSSWGVTCTSTEDIIVTDCNHRRIQKFSKGGDLVDCLQLEEEPRDITTCGATDDVAVTMIGKLVVFFSTRKLIQLIKRTKTEKQYDAIAYSDFDGFLVVSSIREQCVDIIQLDGAILRSFESDPSGTPLFEEPRYVSSSSDGTIIVSDVADNSVKCIDHDGSLLFCYTPDGNKKLKKPQGVCMDKIGNVFIADNGNDRVQLMTSDGVFQRYVLGEDSNLERPCAIKISNTNRMVIIQNDGMVKVFSYS